MRRFKLKVNSNREYEKAQRVLFACGYTWNSGDTLVRENYEETKYLEVNPIRDEAGVLLNDKVLRQGWSQSTCIPTVHWPWLEWEEYIE